MRIVAAVLGLFLLETADVRATSYDDFNAGIALRNQDEYAGALTSLSRAIAAGDLPQHLRQPALMARGLVYEAQNNLAAADGDFSAAIALAPNLISAHVYRADVEEKLGKFDAAIADYSSAIALRPFVLELYQWRGLDYETVGHFADAETDFTFLIGVEPDNATTLFQLGFAQWAQGRFNQARASFESARDLDETFAYAVLWHEITRRSAGGRDSTFKHDARKLSNDKWPAPVVDLFLGNAKPADVQAAAEKGEAKEIDGQKCEAAFYAAEWHLAQNDAASAEPLLSDAARTCPDGFTEKMAAGIELARLKPAATP